jgi:iron(III) transport system substrate-binding protein
LLKKSFLLVPGLILIGLVLSSCAPTQAAAARETLVVYSGRSEALVGPVIEQFEQASGIDVQVRWGETPELAAALLEEGKNSPADVFFAQDPGALGVVLPMLSPLPEDILDTVDARFSDPQQRWVGISGRARTLVYNTAELSPADLPADIRELTGPEWKGRIGWAPGNASFQTMVTAMRVQWGEAETREWLAGMVANQAVTYDKNAALVAAVGAGEVSVGLVNHYYLYRFLQEEGEGFPARNYFFPGGGPESLVMPAGVGILSTTDQADAAEKFIRFLLSTPTQQYFASQTYEYPLVDGVAVNRELTPLAELNTSQVNLADLADMQGTVALLREAGALP